MTDLEPWAQHRGRKDGPWRESQESSGGGLFAVALTACVGAPTAEVAEQAIMGSAPLDVILTRDDRVDVDDPRQWARDASVHFRGFERAMRSDHGPGLEVVDHSRASFVSGGMASCL